MNRGPQWVTVHGVAKNQNNTLEVEVHVLSSPGAEGTALRQQIRDPLEGQSPGILVAPRLP